MIRCYREGDYHAIMESLQAETAIVQATVGGALTDHANAIVWADPVIKGFAATKAY